MRRAIVLFTLTVLAFVWTQAFAGTLTGKVVKVADGDTITVLDNANTQHRIRLQGIDAPERKQAYGNASRKHLASLVAGCRVAHWAVSRLERLVVPRETTISWQSGEMLARSKKSIFQDTLVYS